MGQCRSQQEVTYNYASYVRARKSKASLLELAAEVAEFNRSERSLFNITSSAHSDAPCYPMSEEDKHLIIQALKDNFVFSSLKKHELYDCIHHLKERRVSAGQDIIKQNDIGEDFFIVKDGMMQYIVDSKAVGYAIEGSTFGEFALLYNCLRTATVTALCDSTLWSLDRASFSAIMSRNFLEKSDTVKQTLRQAPICENLLEDQIEKLARVSCMVEYTEGEHITRKGEPGNILYIINSGSVRFANLSYTSKETVLEPGDYFGELALLRNNIRTADAIAYSKVLVVAIKKRNFLEMFGTISKLFEHNNNLRVLSSVPIFSRLSAAEIREIASFVEIKVYSEGDMIITEGEEGKSFYIIKQGKCLVSQRVSKSNDREKRFIQLLDPGDCFGEMSFMQNASRAASVECTEACECFVFSQETFAGILGNYNVKTFLGQKMKIQLSSKKFSTLSLDVPFSRLQKVQYLGKGSFGTYTLVKETKTGSFYALKSISKKHIVTMCLESRVLNEKEILCKVNHPFITKLHNTYKDTQRLYFLLDFCQGGNLDSLIHCPMKEREAFFKTAGHYPKDGIKEASVRLYFLYEFSFHYPIKLVFAGQFSNR